MYESIWQKPLIRILTEIFHILPQSLQVNVRRVTRNRQITALLLILSGSSSHLMLSNELLLLYTANAVPGHEIKQLALCCYLQSIIYIPNP
jgi:hypothetical protein